jgi:hypothetical protein
MPRSMFSTPPQLPIILAFCSGIGCRGAAAADVPDSLRVTARGPGRFFLGGNLIEGPWTLSYASGRLSVNGYRFATPKPVPKRPLSPMDDFLIRVGSLMDSLNRSGTEPARGAHVLYSYCAANSLGVSVSVKGNTVELRLPSGSVIEMQMGLIREYVLPASERVSIVQMHYNEMSMLKQFLESGCVVFIIDSASQEVFPGSHGRTFMRAIDKVKAGQALDAEEAHIMRASVRERVLRPYALERVE